MNSVAEDNLTLQRPMFPSNRNQSVDLLCKSTDWFLYDGNIGRSRINKVLSLVTVVSCHFVFIFRVSSRFVTKSISLISVWDMEINGRVQF